MPRAPRLPPMAVDSGGVAPSAVASAVRWRLCKNRPCSRESCPVRAELHALKLASILSPVVFIVILHLTYGYRRRGSEDPSSFLAPALTPILGGLFWLVFWAPCLFEGPLVRHSGLPSARLLLCAGCPIAAAAKVLGLACRRSRRIGRGWACLMYAGWAISLVGLVWLSTERVKASP